MLDVAIIDDSLENIETLKYLLDHSRSEVNIVATGTTMTEALKILKEERIDIAFLDIQLKRGNIFEVLAQLHDQNLIGFDTVFVTAHGSFEFALKAIRYACLDFITKPIDQIELDLVLDKAIQSKLGKSPRPNNQIDFVIDFLNSRKDLPSSIGVILPKGIIEFFKLEEIIYFKADTSICEVHLLGEKLIKSVKHFGYYLEILTGHPGFTQISKNCLINNKHLKRYNHSVRLLKMIDGTELNASVRYSKGLKQRLLNQNSNDSIFSEIKKFFK